MLVAPRFAAKVSPGTIASLADTTPPWGPAGFVTYKRTYAREVPGTGRVEDWHETVERGCNGLLEIGAPYTQEEIDRLAFYWYMLKGCPAGRPIWQLGTETVRKLGGDSLQNCWALQVDDPIDPFTFAFDKLMLGGGVGYTIEEEFAGKLPQVRHNIPVEHVYTFDCDFVVRDNREGWVDLLRRMLKGFFYTGRPLRFCTMGVRKKNSPIKGFGGVASGPEDLVAGILRIARILAGAVGRRLTPTECMDILNIIGMIVVSGNVRRSAEIAIGSRFDLEFLRAKDWSRGTVPIYRQFSNNTVRTDDIEGLPEEFWEGYAGNGEPYGLFNRALCRTHGRLIDGDGYRPDPGIIAPNPCAEVPLESHEACNLSEQFLANIADTAEWCDVAGLLLKGQKAIGRLPFQHPRTAEVVGRNNRIGVGVTGFHQSNHLRHRDAFDAVYRHLEETDRRLLREHGWDLSIKLTTVKPSGCSRRDTLIATDRGLLRLDEIGDVSGSEWQGVDDLGAATPDGRRRVTKFYVNGEVETRKIVTSDGVELESSLNHRYKVMLPGGVIDWKYVRDLREGDRLVARLGTHPEDIVTPLVEVPQVLATNANPLRQPPVLTEEIAYFLGIFYGNGSVHKAGIRISFNRKQPGLVRWLTTFARETFGLEADVQDDDLCINSRHLILWLRANGVLKDYCEDIHLPRLIRCASKGCATAFIDGFWRTDGGVHNAGNSWTMCSVSEVFARQLHQLCRSVGFNVTLRCAGPGGLGARDRWIIGVRNLVPGKERYLSKEFRLRQVGEFWLDPVVSIRESRCETFDIEVDDVHLYLANGFVSHNTLSLLAGCTPGIHPAYARHHIRRITFAAEHPLVPIIRAHGFVVSPKVNIDGSEDHRTVMAEFPIRMPEGTRVARGYSATRQLEDQKWLQTHWADNSVSMTCYYRKEELPTIREWLRRNYKTSVKTASFLLHEDHGFFQAPYEEITEGMYHELAARTRPIHEATIPPFIEELLSDCVGGSCPVR